MGFEAPGQESQMVDSAVQTLNNILPKVPLDRVKEGVVRVNRCRIGGLNRQQPLQGRNRLIL